VKNFQKKKKNVGRRWRMDETYVKVNGQDRYLYRAVDKEGNTVEFLLTARRDSDAARRFLEKAMKTQEEPSLINIDQSGANTAGIQAYKFLDLSKIRSIQFIKRQRTL
jgi:transposase-like protein